MIPRRIVIVRETAVRTIASSENEAWRILVIVVVIRDKFCVIGTLVVLKIVSEVLQA
jgi:hypothetical protein